VRGDVQLGAGQGEGGEGTSCRLRLRSFSCADHGWVDLVVKQSDDGGATWSPLRLVHSESSRATNTTIGNPAPLWDAGREMVVLPYSRNNTAAFFLTSSDGGATWSQPSPIPVPASWSWVATGPPGGLWLPSGRWVVPSDHVDAMHGTGSHVFVSDDAGTTWAVSTYLQGGNECQAAAMPWVNPSALLLSMRNSQPMRTVSVSNDSGLTWSPAVPVWNETQCEGSIVALPLHTGGPCLVISSAFDVSSRANLTLHASWDDGATWRVAANVYPGGSAYSSLAALPSGGGDAVGVLWERDGYVAISWATVVVPEHA